MPELPEVETVRRQLNAVLRGAVCRRAQVFVPKLVAPLSPRQFALRMKEARIETVERRAKYLLLRLSGDRVLVAHLRMTGQLLVQPADAPADKHVHAVFALDHVGDPPAPALLQFRDMRKFGRLILATTDALDALPELRGLGPDAASVDAATFAAVLNRRTRIKPLLLDQRRLAGLGNIYVDEALHAAGIHPETPADRLRPGDVARLHEAMTRILADAIASGGTTKWTFMHADGSAGRFSRKLQVYQRTGEPCLRCGAAIERIVCGGRGTHFCPRCQRPRRPGKRRKAQASSSRRGK